eukprot:2358059-Pleurochrysis_carterae.AAC.2
MDPSSSMAANVSRGASGKPSLSWRRSAAASSSSSHAVFVRPSARSCSHSSALRQPPRPAVLPLGAFVTAKPPRSGRLSSGATCEMLTSRPRSARTFRQCTRALSRASSRMPSISASRRPTRRRLQAEAQGRDRVAHHHLRRCGVQAELRQAQDRQLRVHVDARVRRRRCAAARHGVYRVEPHVRRLLRRLHAVGERDARKVVDVHLQVARSCLLRAVLHGTRPLRRRSPLRPASRGWWGRLRVVERRLLALHSSRYQRRDVLEAIRREGPSEAHAPVDQHARTAVLVPPNEALHPQVCPLDRAESVGGLSVCDVRRRAEARGTLAVTGLVPARVDDRQRLSQGLDPRELDDGLDVRHVGVDAVGAAEAR